MVASGVLTRFAVSQISSGGARRASRPSYKGRGIHARRQPRNLPSFPRLTSTATFLLAFRHQSLARGEIRTPCRSPTSPISSSRFVAAECAAHAPARGRTLLSVVACPSRSGGRRADHLFRAQDGADWKSLGPLRTRASRPSTPPRVPSSRPPRVAFPASRPIPRPTRARPSPRSTVVTRPSSSRSPSAPHSSRRLASFRAGPVFRESSASSSSETAPTPGAASGSLRTSLGRTGRVSILRARVSSTSSASRAGAASL